MATIMDYAKTEFASFDEKPLCEADSLVFSQLAMVDMDGMVPLHQEQEHFGGRVRRGIRRLAGKRDVAGGRLADLLRAERFDGMFIGLVPAEVQELLIAAATSPRFRDIVVHDYLAIFREGETQFAAMAFSYRDAFTYLAFRGTDRSMTGWKEDFAMACAEPVPAQEAAVRYANTVAARTRTPLVLGGHSKGGNLAVYAAAKMDAQMAERIEAVYNHDGPGFSEGMLSAEDHARLRPLVRKTVPQESLVGLLMEPGEDYRVVKSTGRGMEQHDPSRWQIEEGVLVEANGLAASARFTADVLNEWIAGMDASQRRRAVDALFEAMAASGAKDVFDMMEGGPKTIGLLVEAARKTRPEAREVFVAEMKALSEIAARKVGSGFASLFGRRS